MYVGNLMLLVLNLPLIGVWIRLLRVPYSVLYPMILLFIIIGAYSLSNSIFEVYLTTIFGFLGFILKKIEFEPAPLVLAFVLGPMFEDSFRQALLISRGDLMTFVYKPISLSFLIVGALLILLPMVPHLKTFLGGVRASSEEDG
jgi:putative tricarboxylic transport membrane protein